LATHTEFLEKYGIKLLHFGINGNKVPSSLHTHTHTHNTRHTQHSHNPYHLLWLCALSFLPNARNRSWRSRPT
jgi:hypothetical protein